MEWNGMGWFRAEENTYLPIGQRQKKASVWLGGHGQITWDWKLLLSVFFVLAQYSQVMFMYIHTHQRTPFSTLLTYSHSSIINLSSPTQLASYLYLKIAQTSHPRPHPTSPFSFFHFHFCHFYHFSTSAQMTRYLDPLSSAFFLSPTLHFLFVFVLIFDKLDISPPPFSSSLDSIQFISRLETRVRARVLFCIVLNWTSAGYISCNERRFAN